jgi:hypothetical protein
VKNTLIWIDDKGDITQHYQKIHLFDVDIKGGPILKESAWVVFLAEFKRCLLIIPCIGASRKEWKYTPPSTQYLDVLVYLYALM